MRLSRCAARGTDDDRGIIYRVTGTGLAATPVATKPVPNPILPPPPSAIAFDMFDAEASLKPTADFAPNVPIPAGHGAKGENTSPPLSWAAEPEGTLSDVLIVDDPDAEEPKPFTHWVIYDLPALVTALHEGLPVDPKLPDPKDAKQGVNDTGSTGYTGPEPPVGDPAHHCHFQLFRLDTDTLGLDHGATDDAVLSAMRGHVLAKVEIVGLFNR